MQYLTFHLAGEEYAVGILQVKEIITYGTLTKVPHTPPSIRGVINLRGNVVPVVDLALKFGLRQPRNRSNLHRHRRSQYQRRTDAMGVIADSVNQVIEFSADDILPAPAFGTHVSIDFLSGMGKSGNKFVLLLDIDRVLSATDLDNPAAPSAGATHGAANAID